MNYQPDWMRNEVLDGFCKLVTLSLERTPAVDVIAGTAEIWIEALCHGREWRQTLDQLRIRKAFIALAATCTVWPAPRQLLDAMPRRITVMEILAGMRADPSSIARARAHARASRCRRYRRQSLDPSIPCRKIDA